MHVLHIYINFFFTYIHVDLHMYIYIYIIYTIIYMFDFYLYISFVSVYICIYIYIYMYIHVQIPMIYTFIYIYVYMGTLTQSFGYCTVPNVYGLFFGANPRSFMRFFGRRRYPRNGPLLGVSLSQKCLFLTSCNDSNSLSSSINLRSKQYQ